MQYRIVRWGASAQAPFDAAEFAEEINRHAREGYEVTEVVPFRDSNQTSFLVLLANPDA